MRFRLKAKLTVKRFLRRTCDTRPAPFALPGALRVTQQHRVATLVRHVFDQLDPAHAKRLMFSRQATENEMQFKEIDLISIVKRETNQT
jgi:hypothetical protein